MITKSGIYTDLSNDDYHAEREHISSSNWKQLLKDSEKFHKEKILGNKLSETPKALQNAYDEGNLAHSILLEPHTVDSEYVLYPGMRKAGKDWESFKVSEAAKNRIIISKPQWKRVETWTDNYKKLPGASELFTGCDFEYSLFLEFCGVKQKVRADFINVEKGYIGDLKTTAYPTDQSSFQYTCKQLGYELSTAMYCTLFEEHYGRPFDFYFGIMGKRSNTAAIYKASKAFRERGMVKLMSAIEDYKKRKITDDWTSSKKYDTFKPSSDYEILEI